mgnify:CR=1 FL=1
MKNLNIKSQNILLFGQQVSIENLVDASGFDFVSVNVKKGIYRPYLYLSCYTKNIKFYGINSKNKYNIFTDFLVKLREFNYFGKLKEMIDLIEKSGESIKVMDQESWKLIKAELAKTAEQNPS